MHLGTKIRNWNYGIHANQVHKTFNNNKFMRANMKQNICLIRVQWAGQVDPTILFGLTFVYKYTINKSAVVRAYAY